MVLDWAVQVLTNQKSTTKLPNIQVQNILHLIELELMFEIGWSILSEFWIEHYYC